MMTSAGRTQTVVTGAVTAERRAVGVRTADGVARARLVATGASGWRVVDDTGRAFGHVARTDDARGPRYAARRFHVPTRSFRPVGDFWSIEDAVDCLRLTR